MPTATSLLFECLQIAAGNRLSLSSPLTEADGQRLYQIALKQRLSGLVFCALQAAGQADSLGEVLLIQWYSLVRNIQQNNASLDADCARVTQWFTDNGFASYVIKGQSLAAAYPADLAPYRMAGDIDLYVIGGSHCDSTAKHRVIDFLFKTLGKEQTGEVIHHHIDIPTYFGNEVEVHYYPSYFRYFRHDAQLHRYFSSHILSQDHTCGVIAEAQALKGFNVLPPSLNLIQQLIHIQSHFFTDGIGLRQFVDFYFTLRHFHEATPEKKDEVYQTLVGFGMRRFVSAVMNVMQTVFAMPQAYLLGEPSARHGAFLLQEILTAGNFGQFDPRLDQTTQETKWQRLLRRQKRLLSFVRFYPSECLCSLPFTVYQFLERKIHGWR